MLTLLPPSTSWTEISLLVQSEDPDKSEVKIRTFSLCYVVIMEDFGDAKSSLPDNSWEKGLGGGGIDAITPPPPAARYFSLRVVFVTHYAKTTLNWSLSSAMFVI
jgi:hypothetical protein